MKKIIAYHLIVMLLLQSCNSLYLSTTLQQSVNKGKVKITYERGQEISYEKVTLNNGEYYGVILKDILVNLDTTKIASISYESKVYLVWLNVKNVNTYVKGVLYDVNDSLISVGSSTKKSDYLHSNFTIAEYPISQVERIMIRPYGKVGAGAGIGFMSGALIGGLMYADSGGDPFFLILAYPPLTALTTLIGTIVGSIKKSYKTANYTSVELNGELRKFCLKR